MERPSKNTTEPAVDTAVAEESVAAVDIAADKNMDEVVEEKAVEANKVVKTENVKAVNPLKDSDEIEVVSLISNVSYKDSYTSNFYKWDEAGDVEFMTFETLKNMWRNSKGYFKNLWLKPNDDRVIKKFGLENTYQKYEFLMDESNYTKENIDKLCDSISSTPNELKFTIYNKIKSLVVTGKVVDVIVIRALEKNLKVDLISFLG